MSRRKWSPGDPRRSPGEGSIYERSNGLFAGAITVAPGRRKTFYGKSRREVQQKMVAAMRDHQLGLLPTGGRQTVEQVLTGWIFDDVSLDQDDLDRAKLLIVETICRGLEG